MNVLNGPWIPVRTQENQHIRVTLPDFYAHAHEYRSLETENAFDEFSLARFLALFAHCAYEPKNDDAIEELAEEGKFPLKPIYNYIALCKSEGVTFELFDKERPFLQAIPDDAFKTFDEAMPALSASVLNLGSIEAERRQLFSLLTYAKATHIKKEKLPDRKKEQA